MLICMFEMMIGLSLAQMIVDIIYVTNVNIHVSCYIKVLVYHSNYSILLHHILNDLLLYEVKVYEKKLS